MIKHICKFTIIIISMIIIASCTCQNDISINTQCYLKKQHLKADYLLRQSETEYQDIKKQTDSLFRITDNILYPDSLYKLQYGILKDYFYGEAGEDIYCYWYAYWIAKQNKGKQNHTERINVSNMFYCVNNVLYIVSGGSAGLIHEANRIPSYVEFYLSQYKRNTHLSKTEVIKTIESLWQLAELYIEKEIPLQIQAERLHKTYEIIKYIENQITSDKYLYCLQCYISQNVIDINEN